jgi:hypothetical protein
MAMIMSDTIKVQRGKLLSCEEAGAAMGISANQVRLWVRMKLLYAVRVGRTYAIQSEQLALVSERFHNNFYTDAPVGRSGTINRIELE